MPAPRPAAPAQHWLAHLVRASEGTLERGEGLDAGPDFDEEAIFALASRQQLAPLLHRALSDGCIGAPIPASFRERCERAYYATLRKNVVALETGRGVLRELAAREIPAAPLEGWALMLEPAPIHLDPGTRPLDDLEVMVSLRDLERADAVLQEIGFRPTTRRPAARSGGHELTFHRRDAGLDLFVRLHWAWAVPDSPMPVWRMSGQQFLEELCESGDAHGPQPTRLASLLTAALHTACGSAGAWIRIVDLHRLVASGASLDWDEVIGAARRLRVSRPLYAGLSWARELVRTHLPAPVLAELSPGPLRRRLLQRSLSAALTDESAAPSAWAAKLLLSESWWDVARAGAWRARSGSAGERAPEDPRARRRALAPSPPTSLREGR